MRCEYSILLPVSAVAHCMWTSTDTTVSSRTNSRARSENHCAGRSPIAAASLVPGRTSLFDGGQKGGVDVPAVTIAAAEVPPASLYDSAAEMPAGPLPIINTPLLVIYIGYPGIEAARGSERCVIVAPHHVDVAESTPTVMLMNFVHGALLRRRAGPRRAADTLTPATVTPSHAG